MKVKCLLAVLLLSATATAFAQAAKYGIKSAILKTEAVTMGQKVQGVQDFDDYGRKEASELTMKMCIRDSSNAVRQGVLLNGKKPLIYSDFFRQQELEVVTMPLSLIHIYG